MAVSFAHIVHAHDLAEKDIADAVGTRERTVALLGRLAEVSAPETGTAKVLLLLARMATMACEWIDGDLVIELTEHGPVTRVDVSTELGGGLRERALSPVELRAPLAEFIRAMERVPHMVAPLVIRARGERRITFAASAMVRRTSVPPPPIEISAESLYVRAPAPAVPRDGGAGATLPVVTPGLPLVGGGARPPAPAPARPLSSEPPGDVDAGWDD
jgi:hypothetical protein